MLESISESAVRMTELTNNHLAVKNRDVAFQKTVKVGEERPVVRSYEASETESDIEQKTGGYNSDDDGIFFEKYDEHGNVIFRVPQEHKPVDEFV